MLGVYAGLFGLAVCMDIVIGQTCEGGLAD